MTRIVGSSSTHRLTMRGASIRHSVQIEISHVSKDSIMNFSITTPARATTATGRRRPLPCLLTAAALTLSLVGCADSSAGSSSESPLTMADSVTTQDFWAKSADSGMTAAFGTIANTSSADVQLVEASSDVSTMVQLHETVIDASGTSTMQEKDGGFTIPAGGTLALEPGGDHIMFMDLASPLLAGDTVTIDLLFSDGSTLSVDAPIRDYAGANETYGDASESSSEGTGTSDMDDMSMSGSASASASAMTEE